jgi:hypothetical protein
MRGGPPVAAAMGYLRPCAFTQASPHLYDPIIHPPPCRPGATSLANPVAACWRPIDDAIFLMNTSAHWNYLCI